MDQERVRAQAAIGRAAGGSKGRPHTAQRLAWVLYGAAGWRIRAISREEWSAGRFTTASQIALAAVAGGKVRHILTKYLADLETVMMLTNSTRPVGDS